MKYIVDNVVLMQYTRFHSYCLRHDSAQCEYYYYYSFIFFIIIFYIIIIIFTIIIIIVIL